MNGRMKFRGLKLALAILTLTAFALTAGAREVPRNMFLDVDEVHYMILSSGDTPYPVTNSQIARGVAPLKDYPLPPYTEPSAPFALPMEDFTRRPYIEVAPPFAEPTWIGPTDPYREIRPPFHTMDR